MRHFVHKRFPRLGSLHRWELLELHNLQHFRWLRLSPFFFSVAPKMAGAPLSPSEVAEIRKMLAEWRHHRALETITISSSSEEATESIPSGSVFSPQTLEVCHAWSGMLAICPDMDNNHMAPAKSGYITGAFHCMLLQEAAEIDMRHLWTHDVHPVFDNMVPDLKTLQSGSGRKVGEILRAERAIPVVDAVAITSTAIERISGSGFDVRDCRGGENRSCCSGHRYFQRWPGQKKFETADCVHRLIVGIRIMLRKEKWPEMLLVFNFSSVSINKAM